MALFKNSKEVCVVGMLKEGSGGRREREREKEAMSQRTSRGLMGASQDGLSPTNNRKPLEGREQQERTSPAPAGSSSMSVCYFPIFFLQHGERERERDSPSRISSQLGKSLYVERHPTLFVEERIRNQKETGPTDPLPFLMSESLQGLQWPIGFFLLQSLI